MKKPKPPYNLGTQIRSALRKAWFRHPALQEALKRERIEVPRTKKDGTSAKFANVFYKCAICAESFQQKSIQLDHIVPVGPTPGSKLAPPDLGWDMFIARLFCPSSNLRTVCKPCHAARTKEQTKERWEGYNRAG